MKRLKKAYGYNGRNFDNILYYTLSLIKRLI